MMQLVRDKHKKVSIPYREAKNGNGYEEKTTESKFQFLIGRLKTQRAIKCATKGSYVSIPYREAKNLGDMLSSASSCLVSIPYREAKNHLLLPPFLFPCSFQFLIGRLKTVIKQHSSTVNFTVSIPYREAKNQSMQEDETNMIRRFNSL
ncbi:MAG: hypothetical protein PWQ97_411 [Tepidanaerobacteraceae bacterium]|nr:hypothetical protein [Tepidanaerobacteraceae bacterium]